MGVFGRKDSQKRMEHQVNSELAEAEAIKQQVLKNRDEGVEHKDVNLVEIKPRPEFQTSDHKPIVLRLMLEDVKDSNHAIFIDDNVSVAKQIIATYQGPGMKLSAEFMVKRDNPNVPKYIDVRVGG